jgi:hypothetical protein
MFAEVPSLVIRIQLILKTLALALQKITTVPQLWLGTILDFLGKI